MIIPNQTLKIAKFLAARRGTTYSELIRVALLEYLGNELLKEKAVTAKIKQLGLTTEDENDNGVIAQIN